MNFFFGNSRKQYKLAFTIAWGADSLKVIESKDCVSKRLNVTDDQKLLP